MINRASVPMWGIAGKSAGPPKWAGKKSDRGRGDRGRGRGRDRSHIFFENGSLGDFQSGSEQKLAL